MSEADAAFDRAIERLAGPDVETERELGFQDIERDKRQRAFEIVRDVLEEAGIPFLRANALAEKCYRALGEIL